MKTNILQIFEAAIVLIVILFLAWYSVFGLAVLMFVGLSEPFLFVIAAILALITASVRFGWVLNDVLN